MDKFGIYKLLNSFFDYYRKSSNENKEDGKGFNLSSLLPFNKPAQENTSAQKEPSSQPIVNTPIQSPLLSAMNQHDQFVKRVKEKSKIT